MSQLDLILRSIQSAKAANQAALHALTAVEQMLTMTTEPEEEPTAPEGCQHGNAIEVETLTGSYRVCECGSQTRI